jgi:hypothetical protein
MTQMTQHWLQRGWVVDWKYVHTFKLDAEFKSSYIHKYREVSTGMQCDVM